MSEYQTALLKYVSNGYAIDLSINIVDLDFTKLRQLLLFFKAKGVIPYTDLQGVRPLTINLIFTKNFNAEPGVLMKWLNFTIRMANQAHPINATSRTVHMSEAPKVQAWLGALEFSSEPLGHCGQIAESLVPHRFDPSERPPKAAHTPTPHFGSVAMGPSPKVHEPYDTEGFKMPSRIRQRHETNELGIWLQKWDGLLEYEVKLAEKDMQAAEEQAGKGKGGLEREAAQIRKSGDPGQGTSALSNGSKIVELGSEDLQSDPCIRQYPAPTNNMQMFFGSLWSSNAGVFPGPFPGPYP